MDLRKVKKLIELLEESDIAEIEVNEGEESVRISRHSSTPAAPPSQQHYIGTPQSVPAPLPPQDSSATPNDSGPSTPQASTTASAMEDGEVVKAPIIGTFYRSPAPGKPPFVEEGAAVEAGQTLCIIEAMKMMNQIEAPVSGVLKKFMVEDADPVEYGQAIAVIKT